jgi:hypothetical protein
VSLFSALIGAMFLGVWFSNESLGHKIGLSVPGALFLLPPLAGAYVMLRGRRASIAVYEHGLIYQRGNSELATKWDDIDSYLQETAVQITKKNGEVIEFGLNIEGATEVAAKIEAETLRVMLPKVKAAIAHGSRVQFAGMKLAENLPLGNAFDNFIRASSGFTVDQNCITENESRDQIAWKDVTSFGIGEQQMGMGAGRTPIDVFVVQSAQKSFETRLGLLRNAHVLAALCEEMTRETPDAKTN